MIDTRTNREKRQAARRLSRDGATIRLEEVAALARVSVKALLRWACFGKRGVKLDAVCCSGEWFSSVEAVERFKLETLRTTEAAAHPLQQLPPLSLRGRSDTRERVASLAPPASA